MTRLRVWPNGALAASQCAVKRLAWHNIVRTLLIPVSIDMQLDGIGDVSDTIVMVLYSSFSN